MNTKVETRIRATKKGLPLAGRLLLSQLEKFDKGVLKVETPEGELFVFGKYHHGLDSTLHIHDWSSMLPIILKGEIGLAEVYRDGKISITNLTNFFHICVLNEDKLSAVEKGNPLVFFIYKAKHFFLNKNTKKGSKRNIHNHYDLGNKFFSLWLDKTMTYSSALYQGNRQLTLEEAQTKKYQAMFDSAGIKAGDHVLEIGCGWGGFAEFAASRGARLTCVTISQEQFNFARERLTRAGLLDKVDLRIQDYRDLEGEYDAIVSIEMIEAVGEKFWPVYFGKIKQCLKPGAKAVIQGITINEEDFKTYRKSTDFIQQFIFPGGFLVTDKAMSDQSKKAGLKLEGLIHFGRDYARTLEIWQEIFNEKRDTIKEFGYDEKFQRIWNFYLSYCQGGFLEEKINVIQATLKNEE